MMAVMGMEQVDMVVAYDKVRDELKSKLISNSFSSDHERSAAASFVKEDRYW
jgi:hypothetical protein